MKLYLAIIYTLLGFGMCLHTRDGKIAQPHVESYWESWEEGLGNYASNLIDVPASPIGSLHGVNVINIAFAKPGALTSDDYDCQHNEDPPCITQGLVINETLLKESIREIHRAGAFVKLAIGGDTYGDPGVGLDSSDLIDDFVTRIEQLMKTYNLDGVDLTQARDCGPHSNCGRLPDIQIEMIQKLRERLPNAIISYTFPYSFQSPFYEPVIRNSHPYLDSVAVLAGSEYNMNGIHEFLGVPKYKIVYGMVNTRDYCSIDKAYEGARLVRTEGYGGVMNWSINSDTDHRGDNGPGECTEYQTGYPDGTYLSTISLQLNA